MTIIHHSHKDKTEKIVHDGKEYEQLGQPGELGYGVFDVPESVAQFFTNFPHWHRGDPEGETPIVVSYTPVDHEAKHVAPEDETGNAAGPKKLTKAEQASLDAWNALSAADQVAVSEYVEATA